MKTASFRPNACTFKEGLDRVKKARGGESHLGKIITSKDEDIISCLPKLEVSNIPNGFSKYQIPTFFEGGPGALFYVSVGAPGTKVPKHSHDEGDGIRYIVAGSIIFGDKELAAGDWMFIPKGVPYEFIVGRNGVTAFYCYQCCCA